MDARLAPLAWRADMRLVHAIAVAGKGPRSRPARRLVHRHLGASKRAEAGYVRALIQAFQAAHRATLAHVEPRLEAPELRHDAPPDGSVPEGDPIEAGFLARLLAFLRRRAAAAFDEMAEQVDRKNARALSILGIEPDAAGVLGVLSAAREWNIRLVENAGRAYADDVREVFADPDNVGVRVEALRDQLMARGKVSLSRASLIARDQTLKTNAALSQARQRAAGVTRYRWSTSHDERVRKSHAELDGEAFDYDDPPEVDGEPANPGEPVQCRCIAIPVIPELEEEEPDEMDVAAEE